MINELIPKIGIRAKFLLKWSNFVTIRKKDEHGVSFPTICDSDDTVVLSPSSSEASSVRGFQTPSRFSDRNKGTGTSRPDIFEEVNSLDTTGPSPSKIMKLSDFVSEND